MGLFDKPKTQVIISANYEDPREHKAKDVNDFLHKIAFLESSYGQNLNHPEVTRGPNSGTSAMGEYGIMPLTAQDLDKQYGINELQGLNIEDIPQKMEESPGLDHRIASTLASKLLNKNPSEVAAYKWEHGQNTKPSLEQLDNSQRVQRFRVLQGMK